MKTPPVPYRVYYHRLGDDGLPEGPEEYVPATYCGGFLGPDTFLRASAATTLCDKVSAGEMRDFRITRVVQEGEEPCSFPS